MGTLLEEIEVYWTNRAEGYSQVNRQELATGQCNVWMNEIKKYIPLYTLWKKSQKKYR